MIRAIRLELIKPISETWDQAGPHMRNLMRATPILLNAALDARVAMQIVGKDAVKEKLSPDAKAASPDGIMYQAVLRKSEELTAWGKKKKSSFADLDLPSGIASAISRAAAQAFANKNQGRVKFDSERIIVRASETTLIKSENNSHNLVLTMRSSGYAKEKNLNTKITFAIARSTGSHYETVRMIASGKIESGDCKIQYDARRKKWYALVSYEAQPKNLELDLNKTLVVHRGVKNALTMMTCNQNFKTISGSKYAATRHALRMRMRSRRNVSASELGSGAKGHGSARKVERFTELEGKLSRVTKTYCQQLAAAVEYHAKLWGC